MNQWNQWKWMFFLIKKINSNLNLLVLPKWCAACTWKYLFWFWVEQKPCTRIIYAWLCLVMEQVCRRDRCAPASFGLHGWSWNNCYINHAHIATRIHVTMTTGTRIFHNFSFHFKYYIQLLKCTIFFSFCFVFPLIHCKSNDHNNFLLVNINWLNTNAMVIITIQG